MFLLSILGQILQFYKSWKNSPVFSRLKEAKKEAIFPQSKIFLDVVLYLKYLEKYQNFQICSFSNILWFFGHKTSTSVFFGKNSSLWKCFGKKKIHDNYFLRIYKQKCNALAIIEAFTAFWDIKIVEMATI